jgi:hypothetical protein
MFPYDPALLDAIKTVPESIDDVIHTLEALDALLGEGDGLKWFNWLYLEVTRAAAARIAAPGGFANPAWMAQLDVRFARYYCSALEAWLGGRPAPGCWRAVLERRGRTSIARIQFALAGINAHINHDLPMAVVETFEASGSAPQHGGIQYGDFTALNSTLESLIESAKRQLMVRLPGDDLPPVSHLEDTLAAWSVTAAREAAWTNAELLWDVRDVPLLSGRYLDVIDGLTTVAGKALLVPVPPGFSAQQST